MFKILIAEDDKELTGSHADQLTFQALNNYNL